MSESKPPSRVVVVKLTPREKEDAQAQLAAIRDAMRQKGITLQVRTRIETTEEELPDLVLKDEPLETKARELASAVLDREAAKAKQQTADSFNKSEMKVAEVVAQRQGAKAYLAFLTLRGVKIGVDIFERIGDLTGTVVKKIHTFFGGPDGGKDA